MTPDAAIAERVLALYHKERWGEFEHVETSAADGGICWAVGPLDDAALVVFRGSKTCVDWFRDLCCWPLDPVHTALGPVHAGFFAGMEVATLAIAPWLKGRPLVIAGHSLGAARAWLYAGILKASIPGYPNQQPTKRVVTFGSPRPGFAKLAALLGEIPSRSYRNRHDPVCCVPFAIPPLFPYVEPAPFTLIDAAPEPHDPWLGMADHHMELYAKGV
jgi:hypothetical protein